MTRTHVEEAELLDLQRNALEVFQKLNKRADSAERDGKKSAAWLGDIADLARKVSDAVDDLTDYVRHSRMPD